MALIVKKNSVPIFTSHIYSKSKLETKVYKIISIIDVTAVYSDHKYIFLSK